MQPSGVPIEKLKDQACAQEFAKAVSNWFEILGTVEDPGELWGTFKPEITDGALRSKRKKKSIRI